MLQQKFRQLDGFPSFLGHLRVYLHADTDSNGSLGVLFLLRGAQNMNRELEGAKKVIKNSSSCFTQRLKF